MRAELVAVSFVPEPLRLVLRAVRELHSGVDPSHWDFTAPFPEALLRAAAVVEKSRGAYVPEIVGRVPVACYPMLAAFVVCSLEALPEFLPPGLTTSAALLDGFNLPKDLFGQCEDTSPANGKEERRASAASTAATAEVCQVKKKHHAAPKKDGKAIKEERAERRAARREQAHAPKSVCKGSEAAAPKEVKSRRSWAVEESDAEPAGLEAEAAHAHEDDVVQEEVDAAIATAFLDPSEGIEMIPSGRARRKAVRDREQGSKASRR